MQEFPFTEAEWGAVSNATLPVVNAVLADDQVLRDSHLVGLQEVLAELRSRYGDHPVLLETEADFGEIDVERIVLYQRAISAASAHRLPTLSIRLSLARVLLDLGRPAEAAAELAACEHELSNGDESERAMWSVLAQEARSIELATDWRSP